VIAATLLALGAPAFANTTNATTATATGVINADGSETVTMSGNWTWPSGQSCTGRYGTGWVVGWWGIGASQTPANNFTLTNASTLISTDQGINGNTVGTGSITSTGSIKFSGNSPFPNDYFYVPTNMNNQEIFTQSFCNSAQPPNGSGNAAFSGTYTATATYPSAQDVPSQLCVNTYDVHGQVGKPSSGNDYSPSQNGDNSIQQNQFVLTSNCTPVTVLAPSLSITKSADAPSVSAGSPIGFKVTVGNSASATANATGVTLSDPLPGGSGVSWSISPAYSGAGNCSIAGTAPSQTLNCSYGDMAPGATNSVHITSGTTAASVGTYNNSATASATNTSSVQASASTQVLAPALGITKTADAPAVSAGTPIGFTIGVSNSSAAGTGTATSVTMSDPLPHGSGVSWVISPAYSAPGSCSIAGAAPSQTLNCSFGDMAPGASASVHITSSTTSATAGTYPNTATATATNVGTPVKATAKTSVLGPGLSIVKTADAPSVSAGSPIGFTVTVANSSAPGTGTATGVTVSDPLPAGSGVSWSISPAYSGQGTCSITGSAPSQTLNCTIGDMAPMVSASVHISSATTAASAGTYPNTATANATNIGTPINSSATTSVLAPDLSILKTADAPSVSAGSPIGFTVTVSNSSAAGTGPATSVTMTDPLPPGPSQSGIVWSISPAYSGPGTCSIAGSAPSQTLNCSFGDIAPGASTAVHVTSPTSFASVATYTNTATATGTNTGTPTSTSQTTVLPPDLAILKTADAKTVNAGTSIGFTVTVSNVSTNSGTGTAKGVTMSDPLPPGSGINWAVSPAYSGPGTCSITGTAPSQTLNCAFGDMAPGASASVHVSSATSASSVGTYDNTATASATNGGPPVQSTAITSVLGPGLNIIKTADAPSVSAGTPIGFTITVSNSSLAGTGTATSVTLADPLPSGSGVSWSISPAYSGAGTCSISGNAPNQALNCSFGDMAPGASNSVHIKSATTAASAGTYNNIATANATNIGTPIQATATTMVLAPALSITKTADAPSVSAGSPIGFTVAVSNSGVTGTGTATAVTVSDPLPHGSGVSWSISPAYSGPGTCSISGTAPSQTLNCSLGDLAAGASASVHISSATTSASVGTYNNTAIANASNIGKPIQATATTSVYGPDLTIIKTADAPSVVEGSPIGFTVTVSNVSTPTTGTATSVTLSDPLPASPSGSGINWSISPAYSGQGTCSITGTAPSQTLSCSFGDMAPGASATVHITSATSLASVGTYNNTATANATNIGTPIQASATTKVLAPTLKIFFGYADGLRTAANSTPGSPWEGSPDTNFVGCPNDACPNGKNVYDGGAVLIENNSAKSLTLSSGFVTIGHCTFTPWGTGITIPAESGSTLGALAMTQTTKGIKPQGNQAGCPLVTGPTINDNFDTSETDPVACSLQTQNDGLIPKVSLTINNQTFTLNDTNQVLNTGGRDRGCGGNSSETTPWTLALTTTLGAQKKASKAPASTAVGAVHVASVRLQSSVARLISG
jgi:uncharacterized repeat protein (TIGR01451 family)